MEMTTEERIAELEREVNRLSIAANPGRCLGMVLSVAHYDALLVIERTFPTLQAEYDRTCRDLVDWQTRILAVRNALECPHEHDEAQHIRNLKRDLVLALAKSAPEPPENIKLLKKALNASQEQVTALGRQLFDCEQKNQP